MKKITAILLCAVLVLSFGVMAFADIGDNVSSALTQATNTIIKVVNPIAIFCVIGCGLYCIMGSDPGNIRKAKSWGIAIFVGLILVNAAGPIVDWVQSIQIS